MIYQICTLLTPLVTMPYVSRILGSSGIGQYSFVYSIVSYFVLLSSLGFGYYAQREVAKYQDDKYNQSKVFWEICIDRFGSVLISAAFYFLMVYFVKFDDVYRTLLYILSINIFATAFDVTFFFQGNENFSIIAIRNIIIKIVGVIGIIIFVKSKDDVWIYSLCQSIILIISNLSLWINIPSKIEKVNFRTLNFKRHIKPTLRLFIPTIAMSVYVMLDKTLIGVLVPGSKTTIVDGTETIIKNSDIENGYYEQAEKIVKMTMTVITSLGTVMIPRNSNAIQKGDLKSFEQNIYNSLQFVSFLALPMMFGLFSVTINFSPWFFGNGFEKVPYLMMIFSPLILIIGMSNVLGLQYLIPLGEDKKYTIAILIGSFSNIILNFILIPFLWSYGAAIATVISEFLVTITMMIFVHKKISFLTIVKRSWKNILSSIIMLLVCFPLNILLKSSILNTILIISVGIVIYVGLLFILHDKTMLDFVKKLKNNLRLKKK